MFLGIPFLEILLMLQISCMPPNIEGNMLVFKECRALHPAVISCMTVGNTEVIFRHDLMIMAYDPEPGNLKAGYYERTSPATCEWKYTSMEKKQDT
jgi:hypothetical protein